MSQKTLGQVAFEACMGFSLEPWEPTGLAEQSWERAAQAMAENVRQQCMEDVYTAMPDGVPYELSDVIAAWRHGERP